MSRRIPLRLCGVPTARDMWTRAPIEHLTAYRAELEHAVALAIIEVELECDGFPRDAELLRYEVNGAVIALRHLGGYGTIAMDLEWAKRVAQAYEVATGARSMA